MIEKKDEIITTEEIRERLWNHKENTNSDFNSFSNFFLVAESILLAIVGNILDKPNSKVFMYGIITLGFLLTGVWFIVQRKQHILLLHLKKRCEDELPEYRQTHKARKVLKINLSNTWILTWLVPFLFAATWLIILLGQEK